MDSKFKGPGRSRAGEILRAAVKRALDVALAALALVILSPLFLVIALLVVIDSPGPVFYRADRVGFRGRPLRMLKFRKMRTGAGGVALTVAGDERLTRLGAWLARTKLDELPQLWHVLRGEMSLVGPRPESPSFVARFQSEYDVILRVRPGLTGYTQLAFAREGTILDPSDPQGQPRSSRWCSGSRSRCTATRPRSRSGAAQRRPMRTRPSREQRPPPRPSRAISNPLLEG